MYDNIDYRDLIQHNYFDLSQGKVSRMLAAKASLACRVDALGEDAETSAELGMEQRMKIESRIRQLEGGHTYKVSGTGKAAAKHEKFEFKSEVMEYKTAADNTLNAGTAVKRKLEETGDAAGRATYSIFGFCKKII